MTRANPKILVLASSIALVALNFICNSPENYGEGINYEDEQTRDLKSINLGNGDCLWRAPKYTTPDDIDFYKTLVVGYPNGDKRLAYLQMEALVGFSAKDEWDFKYLGMTNNPFIKANYPHHEGIWGWEDVADQVVFILHNIRSSMVEYHDILWDIGYATTWYEVAERITNLYSTRPPIEDFLEWRDLRVLDEVHYYGWFIDFYMEGGLMRDVYSNKITTPEHWKMFQLPHHYSRDEISYERMVGDQEVLPSYDPHCTNSDITNGCIPVQIISGDWLIDIDKGAAEARKIAIALNHTGIAEHMIAEEAWECIWRELIVNKKGSKTFLDRDGIDERNYNFSTEMLQEMLTELERLITKYSSDEWISSYLANDIVATLTDHRSIIQKEYDEVATGRRRLSESDFLGRDERKRRKIERIEKELREELKVKGKSRDKKEISRLARVTWTKQEEEKQNYKAFFKNVEVQLDENRKNRIKSKVFVDDMKRKQEGLETNF